MEILFEIFKATMCVVGIFFFILLIISMVMALIQTIKTNKIKKEIMKTIDEELEKSFIELSKKESTKKRKKSKKEDIQE